MPSGSNTLTIHEPRFEYMKHEDKNEDVLDTRPTPTEAAEPAEKIQVSDEEPVIESVGALQHPATEGAAEVEIEQRSPDALGKKDGRWYKTFVITPAEDYENNKDYVHTRNYEAVLTEAIANGVHPKGEPRLESDDRVDLDRSVALTYSVEVDASIIDHDASTTVTPSKNRE